jgi:hypothetical protein
MTERNPRPSVKDGENREERRRGGEEERRRGGEEESVDFSSPSLLPSL